MSITERHHGQRCYRRRWRPRLALAGPLLNSEAAACRVPPHGDWYARRRFAAADGILLPRRMIIGSKDAPKQIGRQRGGPNHLAG